MCVLWVAEIKYVYVCMYIHKSTVVGLFMTPTGQRKRLDHVMVECTCLLHIALL